MCLRCAVGGSVIQGVVIKENANQNYASNAGTMALVRVIAGDADVPVQDFVVRNDCRCGGTVGAMLSAHLGKSKMRCFFTFAAFLPHFLCTAPTAPMT